MIDYHIHTKLCNHARGVMGAYVKRALEKGLQEICFLDHLTLTEPGNRLSMTPGEVPFYFQAVQQLKKSFNGMISVKAGLEVDFSPENTDRVEQIIETFSFDVIGSSIHFPGNIDIVNSQSDWKQGRFDTDEVYGLYFSQLKTMLQCDYFDVICHLDLPKKFGRQPVNDFNKQLDEIITRIKDKDLTVELNTGGYNHPVAEAYPAPGIIKKCHQAGIRMTLGSDAHHPDDVGRHFDRAISLLREAGYTHLASFTGRQRFAIPLEKHGPKSEMK
ncbi:MAG: histidinol-phosphatase HisJ family protein [Thermodesulfobacteriota bacterium]|nr:histidinol-phosphatase HisJ family protein [Thermodesulfobacteriota bacterium]